jgi:choice-of-anchor B domain-containing protein
LKVSPAKAAVALALLLPLARSHEDDPKVLDKKPPVQSPAYRSAAWGRGDKVALGVGETFAAHNATLLSWLPLGEFGALSNGNDCWGYTSPSGREYALFGSSTGLHVVEITNPSDATIVGFINGPDSLWRGVKIYKTYAYVVSEGGSGIQVVNLANVDAGVVSLVNTITTGGTSKTHTIALDETSGFLYRCGGDDNGLRMYSLANPASPSFVGSWNDRYVHEAQIKTYTSGPYAGKQIAFCCGGFNGGFQQTGLSIVDVTNKSNPIHMGQVTWPGARFSHQGWLSADSQLFFLDDELDENGVLPTTTYVIDVSNLSAPSLLGSFTNGNSAIGHNLYVKGNLCYEANYTSGLRVFDVSNPLAAQEIAFFDTDPSGDATTFNGLWSNYPFFPSGTVIGGDIDRGLFVLWIGAPKVEIEIQGGPPAAIDPDGMSLTVNLTELTPGIYATGSARLFYDAGAGAVQVPLTPLGGGAFNASFPELACGTQVSYYLAAESIDGTTWIEPPNGALHEATVANAIPIAFSDDLESASGWTAGAPGDTASAGIWERVDPVGTTTQPADDHSEPGASCYVTGQASLSSTFGDNDVDGGKTTLLTPVLDLSGTVDPRISYWRWYSNSKGINPHNDSFEVDVSSDGGSTWTNVEVVGPAGPGTDGGWIRHEFRLLDFTAVSASVRLRFVASDNVVQSEIEAAIDDLVVLSLGCPDCNQNGASDSLEVAGGFVLDLDQEGTPDECQPLSADLGQLDVSLGGTASFSLQTGTPGAFYFLLGSLSGTQPGFDVGFVHVPLVQDVYFGYALAHPNTPPLLSTFGSFDPQGEASAQFALVPGLTSLVGLTAHHAWLELNPATLAVAQASNALPLTFVP